MNGKNGKANGAGIEIFHHISQAQQNAAKPSEHLRPTAIMGWMSNLQDLEAGDPGGEDENVLTDEMLQSLSIVDKRERDLIAIEMAIGRAANDYVSASLIEHRLRLSPSIKGQGRKDLKEIMGGVKQSISMPTSLQKMRRVLTGRGGKEIEEENSESLEMGAGE